MDNKYKLTETEVKEELLKMLLLFQKICNNNGLKFYLAGGTLLGAIRHKGFIPWDDDIDVCMPRKDYEKLKYITKKIEGKYVLKKSTYYPFSKFINEKSFVEGKYNSYDNKLWIDIMPVDGLPEDIELVEKIYSKIDFQRKILKIINSKLGEGTTRFRKYIKYILKPLAMIYGYKRCKKTINKIAQKYNYSDSKYVGAVTWGLYGKGERMLKAEFEKAVLVEFEGYKFETFSCWDSYLNGLYGNYMELPPVEKRKTHDMEVYLKK